jgi:hypothetical protein
MSGLGPVSSGCDGGEVGLTPLALVWAFFLRLEMHCGFSGIAIASYLSVCYIHN